MLTLPSARFPLIGGASEGGCRPQSRRQYKKEPLEDVPGLRSRNDYRVEAEPASVPVQCEYQHQHQQKEIGPGPFTLRAVEAEPQIEDLQRADNAPKTHKDTEQQRD